MGQALPFEVGSSTLSSEECARKDCREAVWIYVIERARSLEVRKA